jgi:hypothetical protein
MIGCASHECVKKTGASPSYISMHIYISIIFNISICIYIHIQIIQTYIQIYITFITKIKQTYLDPQKDGRTYPGSKFPMPGQPCGMICPTSKRKRSPGKTSSKIQSPVGKSQADVRDFWFPREEASILIDVGGSINFSHGRMYICLLFNLYIYKHIILCIYAYIHAAMAEVD